MNYHKNSYTGTSRKKILIRTLIVVGALIVVAAATLAYGNYLKSKAANTDVSGTGAGRNARVSGVGRNPSGDIARAKSVKSICVPVEALDDGEKAANYVDELAEGGATGITVLLVDREGLLTYDSENVAGLTHQKNTGAAKTSAIADAIARAKAHSMQTSAVMFVGADFNVSDKSAVAAAIDSLVVEDAAALGFDELVVVLPLDAAALSANGTDGVADYLAALTAKKNTTALGVCLAFEVYAAPALSPQIEVIAAGADFLALDLTADAGSPEGGAQIVKDAVDAISGSFTLYSLRTVFGGSDEATATAQIKALADAGFENYMFITALPNAIPKDEDETDTDTAESDEPWYDPGAVDTQYVEETYDEPIVTEAPPPETTAAPMTEAPEQPQTAATEPLQPQTEQAQPQTEPAPPQTETAPPQTEPAPIEEPPAETAAESTPIAATETAAES